MNMDESMGSAESVFGRCPTCLQNMIKSICSFSCAPDQSRFMDPIVYSGFGNYSHI